jgi:predicted negative regulator of RcsB-dependent stress response
MSYSDDEQVEALRAWWRENGRSVIAGVVVAIVALVGWQQWNAYKQERAENASTEYAALREQLRAEQPADDVVARGETIIDRYSNTPYAPLTALLLAQHHVATGELDQAAERLRWAAAEADSEPVRRVAQLRLARVLAAQKKFDDALAALEPMPGGAFASEYQEVRGDVLAAAGRQEDAIVAYRAALADQDIIPQRRSIIQLKLNDLGASAEPVA